MSIEHLIKIKEDTNPKGKEQTALEKVRKKFPAVVELELYRITDGRISFLP